MNESLQELISDCIGAEYISSLDLDKFSSIESLSKFVKEANKNGLGVTLRNDTGSFHKGVVICAFDTSTCKFKDFLL